MKKKVINLIKKIIRFFNKQNLFIELTPEEKPTLILTGFTRSGTTYIAKLISDILKARCIHESLHPEFSSAVSFFHEREAGSSIKNNPKQLKALKSIFLPNYRGKARDMGSLLIYSGRRVIKLVRANFYLDLISKINPGVMIVFIVRNPLAAINSRFRKGYNIPDHSKAIQDIIPFLNNNQLEILEKSVTLHEKMTISWCLDNYMAFRNYNNPAFYFIYYEEFVNSFDSVNTLLKKTGYSIPEKTIEKKIKYYKKDQSHSALFPRVKLEKRIGTEKTNEIINVLKIFGFEGIYNYDTGEPETFDSFLMKSKSTLF